MKVLFIILLLFLLLVCLLIFNKSEIIFSYDGEAFKLKIKNAFLSKKLYFSKKDKKSADKKMESSEPEEKVEGYKAKYKEYKSVIKTFMKLTRNKIEIKNLELCLNYGCSDAAKTGILYGVLWGALSAVHNALNLYFNSDYPKVNITPDFQNKKFEIKVYGILRVRLVHIINAILKIKLMEIKKNRKERGK